MNLTPVSIGKLHGLHPELVRVVNEAVKEATRRDLEFQITEGLRSAERQKELIRKGASKTMRSRHLTGHAFDFVPIVDGEMCWKWPAFWPLVDVFERAAASLGIEVEAGARWKSFPDGPHIQLPWSEYP